MNRSRVCQLAWQGHTVMSAAQTQSKIDELWNALKVGPAKFLLLPEETMCHVQPVTGHTSYSPYSKKIPASYWAHLLFTILKKKIQQRLFLKIFTDLLWLYCENNTGIYPCIFSPNSSKRFYPQLVWINNFLIGKHNPACKNIVFQGIITGSFPKACPHRTGNKIPCWRAIDD